jgi:hypothetical protein
LLGCIINSLISAEKQVTFFFTQAEKRLQFATLLLSNAAMKHALDNLLTYLKYGLSVYIPHNIEDLK